MRTTTFAAAQSAYDHATPDEAPEVVHQEDCDMGEDCSCVLDEDPDLLANGPYQPTRYY